MNLEDKMKNRFDKNLDNVVKNPYQKKKVFPLWAKVTIPLGGALTVGLVTAVVLPIALNGKNGLEINKETPNLNQMRQLRSPEDLSHNYTYSSTREAGYLAFKEKMLSFSTSLSESFVNDQYDEEQNIVFSPLSIELCLGLAVRSSDGNTRKELLDAFGVDYETFNTYYKLFYNENTRTFLNSKKKYQGEVSLTNSIWIDDEIKLLDSGLDALRDDYYCYSYEVDFNNKNEQTNLAIKEFINDKTHGLLNPDLKLSPITVFILMNTLYMKDIWNDEAEELSEASPSYRFLNTNGEYSSKRLLRGYYNSGKAIEKEQFSSFYTETRNGIKITFIKPNVGYPLKEVLTKDTIDYVLSSKNYTYSDKEKNEEYYTNCIFPEYTAESNLDFKDILRKYHAINDFFSPSCNFSNLASTDVMCSKLTHIAKLVVNKKGAEGAAVTIAEMVETAAPIERAKVYDTFVVDQEFGYVVSYNNNVLFSGVVTNIDK